MSTVEHFGLGLPLTNPPPLTTKPPPPLSLHHHTGYRSLGVKVMFLTTSAAVAVMAHAGVNKLLQLHHLSAAPVNSGECVAWCGCVV